MLPFRAESLASSVVPSPEAATHRLPSLEAPAGAHDLNTQTPPPNLHTQLLRAILETQGSQSLDSKERAPFSTLSFLFYPVPIIVRPQARSETDEKIFFFPFDGSLTNLSRSCRESCREHRLFCRGAESAYQTWADALLLLSDCLEKGKHTMK